ncbi:MAG: hypothetical protein CMH65_06550 [Nevskiales bacterium]|nr:hypothetical protein [Nevskiales bacterium]
MDLHGKIMNIPANVPKDYDQGDYRLAYQTGHRDARHAAAELAMAADACIRALRLLDERLRECSNDPISAAEAYDSYYRAEVVDALALLTPNAGIQRQQRS